MRVLGFIEEPSKRVSRPKHNRFKENPTEGCIGRDDIIGSENASTLATILR